MSRDISNNAFDLFRPKKSGLVILATKLSWNKHRKIILKHYIINFVAANQ